MQGKLIVLEGIDGCGKSTQYEKICRRLEDENVAFRRITFPRYDKESSALIRMYLGGEFGTDPSDVSAYAASTFYAVDRYASYKTDWRDYYLSGGMLMSDRYTTSNAVHQGAKIQGAKLNIFLDWLYDFEFRLMELPKPDLVIYLDIDIETSLLNMRLRQDATHTKGDIHETDVEYLKKCLKAGSYAADHYGWRRIDCIENGKMRGIDDIHESIYNAVKSAI